jgi:hypothetical protein
MQQQQTEILHFGFIFNFKHYHIYSMSQLWRISFTICKKKKIKTLIHDCIVLGIVAFVLTVLL